jgi:S-adenosylmethionine synthetase
MNKENSDFLFTSEAGMGGHPDKIADQIADAILDAHLEQDPLARVGCQVMVTNAAVMIGGQITSKASVDLVSVARAVIKDIGYVDLSNNFNHETCEILVHVTAQSEPLSKNVNEGGAGDSAVVFGYACTDTIELMPLPTMLVHGIAMELERLRALGVLPNIGPDGKIQITVEYRDLKPVHVSYIVVSVQHEEGTDLRRLHEQIRMEVIPAVIPQDLINDKTIYDARTQVGFTIGGPQEDCGLSGRKVIADTYGGWARHGGGGLSGKDPTKIDRSAMYMSRYIAKNLVAAGVAERCELQIAYAIGKSEPVSINVNLNESAKFPQHKLIQAIRKVFPLSPHGMIGALDLRRPIYRRAGVHGHFGRKEAEFTWEKTDKTEDIRLVLGLS